MVEEKEKGEIDDSGEFRATRRSEKVGRLDLFSLLYYISILDVLDN
jgi:hypothetical protein